jgi:hypothetical protein
MLRPQEVVWLCPSLMVVNKVEPEYGFGELYEELRLNDFSVKEYLISDRLREKYQQYFRE